MHFYAWDFPGIITNGKLNRQKLTANVVFVHKPRNTLALVTATLGFWIRALVIL